MRSLRDMKNRVNEVLSQSYPGIDFEVDLTPSYRGTYYFLVYITYPLGANISPKNIRAMLTSMPGIDTVIFNKK